MEVKKPSGTVPGRALTDWLYTKSSVMKIPLSGTFELSPVCNFSCRMCYVRKTRKEVEENPRKILTLDDWRRIAREGYEAGLLYILLTGGEPLLWPDFWTLYDELIDMGMLVSINTNGSLIDEKAIAHFVKKPPLKISITLYGANDETYRQLCGVDGVFSKVDRAIRGLKAAGIDVKLNCSLTPDNAADLDWIMEYGKTQDLIVAATPYMFPPIRRDPSMIGQNERFTPEEAAKYLLRYLRLEQDKEAYLKYLKRVVDRYTDPPGLDEGCVDPVDGKIRCRAGRASFWITWDGWLTPCGLMPEPKADLTNRSFSEAWKDLTAASDAIKMSGVCDKCANRNICHTCAAIARAETGSTEGIPLYKCRMTQSVYEIARKALSEEHHVMPLPDGNSK